MMRKLVMLAGAASLLAASMQTAAAQQARSHDVEIDATGSSRYTIQSDVNAAFYSSNAFTQVTVAGITTTRAGIIIGTFTAESQCTAAVYCSMRMVCDNGVGELRPAVGTEFIFNDNISGSPFQSLSFTRHSNLVAAGTYNCQVQTARVGASGSHLLDDWTFELEFRRVP